MGCSSSSAQTVDQEKRPGTKPEESNGDTLAVRHVINTGEAQTIEDQMQLPVQTTLPEDLQPGSDDEAEVVLVALEAKEDLNSGVDLLPVPEPQQEPVATADSTTEAASPTEASTEPGAVLVVVEDLPVVEEPAPVETIDTEATPEVEVFVKSTEEVSSVESIVDMQADPHAVVEETTAGIAEASSEIDPPAVEPVISEPTEAPVAEEKAAVSATEAPVKVVAPVEAEAPTDNAAVDTASTALCESAESTEAQAPAQSDASALVEPAAPGEGVAPDEVLTENEVSAPLQLEDPVIDTNIAVATIPEMPPLSPEAQAKTQTSIEDTTVPSVAPAITAPTTEAPCHSEAIPEASAALEGSLEVVSTLADSTAPSASAPRPSLEVESEASQDTEREKAKKED
ncbi:uncharacterized protein LKV04_006678 [Tautogolabrus adspersus]